MWVSKDQWESLNNRIRVLESRTAPDSSSELNITVYDQEEMRALTASGCYPWHLARKQDISIKTVVEKILAHLSMELTYTKGTPAMVTMRKREDQMKVRMKA